MSENKHRAGFVNIIGNPNVGKSTLMNALVGEKLSIVTAKAQTTRHRIMGIVNGEDYQIVYSDTPGILKPNYRLQQNMLDFVDTAIGDADIILYVTDTVEKGDKNVTAADMKQILDGITLEDGDVKADAISYASETDKKQVGIEIHSGKNRIVRRIFETLGYEVKALDRVYFAGLTKKGLKKGDWRYLTEGEVNILKMGAYV